MGRYGMHDDPPDDARMMEPVVLNHFIIYFKTVRGNNKPAAFFIHVRSHLTILQSCTLLYLSFCGYHTDAPARLVFLLLFRP